MDETVIVVHIKEQIKHHRVRFCLRQ